MAETMELSQRVTALEKRVTRLDGEVTALRSELTNKVDVKNSELLEKIMAVEKEQVRVTTVLQMIQNKLEMLSSQPSFEHGFHEKMTQLALFVASAAVGVIIVHVVERLAQ